ncbi:MAG: rhombosortase, partial [Gammaproteobacteria bacterium]
LAAALFFLVGPGAEAWIYDREAIARGEWWRLATGHWIHGDGGHLLWNLLALVLLGWLLETLQVRWLALALGAGMAGVDAWLWWGDAGLRYYCGLSGILNSVLAAYLLLSWRARRHPVLAGIAIVAVGKVLIEIARHEALLTDTLWPGVPEAHAAGLLAGLLFAGFATVARKSTVISRGQ